MPSLSDNIKYSIKFPASRNSLDASTRTLSGFNLGGGSTSGTGPVIDSIFTHLPTVMRNFSTGDFSNWRWISEREVTL